MVKRRGFFIIIAFMLIFSGINIFLFVNKTGNFSYYSISGKILEDLPNIGTKINLSIIAFIIQWIILLSILFFAYSKFLKHKQQENTKIDYSIIKRKKGRAETDLDTLYNLLKAKKNLSIEAVSKVFSIKKEKALEWAKILENHELVRIEYPAFSSPEIKLNGKENENKKEDKNKKEGKENQKQTKEKEGKAKGNKIPAQKQNRNPSKTKKFGEKQNTN